MKIIIFLALVFYSKTVDSQKVEFISGLNINKYYDLEENLRGSNYTSEIGYNLGISLDWQEISWLKAVLNFTNYSGNINISKGGRAGGTNLNGSIRKSIVSFDIYPIKIRHKFEIDIGISSSILIRDNTEGRVRTFVLNSQGPPIDTDDTINERFPKINSNAVFGLIGKIAYRIQMFNNLEITPYYSYYIGMTKEFEEFIEETRSMRHTIGLGISKPIIE